MSEKEIIDKLIALANAIIVPAEDILPETYDKELKEYWHFINQLKENKVDKNTKD